MQFQHNFVKTVKDMRVTSKTIPHTIFDYPNFDDGEDAKVFHDDALLHHWHEAAAACELYMLNSLFVLICCVVFLRYYNCMFSFSESRS